MYILLVEDNPDLAEMYTQILTHAGHNVTHVADAQESLDEIENAVPDLILLDILLAEHNGLNILHELQTYHDWHKIPVVILSNLSQTELGLTRAQLDSMSVKVYLPKGRTKPAQLVEVLKKISNGSVGKSE